MAITARWKNHIEDWQASGLSQAEYCRRHGLNANTFSGRLHHYRSHRLPQPPELIPVQVKPLPTVAEAAAGPVVLWHRGHKVEFPAAVSARWLAELLQCLGSYPAPRRSGWRSRRWTCGSARTGCRCRCSRRCGPPPATAAPTCSATSAATG